MLLAPDALTYIHEHIHDVDIQTYTSSVSVLSTPVFQASFTLI